MATTLHTAYTAAAATVLTTELNSLANGSYTAASTAIDNTSNCYLFADFELVLAAQGSARSAGATVSLYIVSSLDGTNYGDAPVSGTTSPSVVWSLDAATTARRLSGPESKDVPIPPGKFKIYALNSTGQALAASANTVSIRYHNVSTA